MKTQKTKALWLAMVAPLFGTPVWAQGLTDEVIVTARKRAENIQDVPIAVTAFDASQMERLDVQSSMGLSTRVPNLLAPRNTVSFSAPQFFMRGAGRAENNWNYENAVAVFIDEVYLQSTAGAYIDMMDIESVEVLRGPQGTLYGRNATTGAISFRTRKPELDHTRFMADATVGSNGRMDGKVSVSTPIVENELGIKLDAFRTSNDGYATLVSPAGAKEDDDFAEQEHRGARLAVLWEPEDGQSYQLAIDGSKQDNGTNLITPILPRTQ